MPDPRCTRSRRSTRGCAEGFSLVEVLVSLAVVGAIMAGTVSLALSGRAAYRQDQIRTGLNQNLRAGVDLLGSEVRLAGLRLTADAPAVELIDGSPTGADRLILRKNLVHHVLPLCQDLNAGSSATAVVVARSSGSIPPGCAPVTDSNADGWPDNLEAWRAHRTGRGGAVPAYIYNPTTGNGEFFVYDSEDAAGLHIHRGSAGTWLHDYSVPQGSRVYLMEQREFRLEDDILQCVINEDLTNPLNLATLVQDLQIRAWLEDGSVLDSVPRTMDWTTLRTLEITLSGNVTRDGRTIERTVASQFFPRSILSE